MLAPFQQRDIDALRRAISEERLGTYLAAAGFDVEQALRLYVWNAQMGEAFHVSIQAVEIALRNQVNHTLIDVYGARWWEAPPLLMLLSEQAQSDIRLVLTRIRNRRLEVSNGQVVAGLSFGFWVGLLQKRYNPSLWSGRLHSAFPHYPPERNRATLAATAARVATLRNRIAHHEPIFQRDLSLEHADIMRLLRWISPRKAAWIRPYCRVQNLLRQKP